jgi:hypothetical protein
LGRHQRDAGQDDKRAGGVGYVPALPIAEVYLGHVLALAGLDQAAHGVERRLLGGQQQVNRHLGGRQSAILVVSGGGGKPAGRVEHRRVYPAVDAAQGMVQAGVVGQIDDGLAFVVK